MSFELIALGVSHKTAPLPLRERLALPEGRATAVLGELRSSDSISEVVAISTCNRTEIYMVTSDAVEAESAADGGVQTVGGDQITAAGAVDGDARVVLPDVVGGTLDNVDPRGAHGRAQGCVQRRTADASSRPGTERRLCSVPAGDVPDARQGFADRIDAKGRERTDRAGHQTLPTRLVDDLGPRLPDDDLETGPGRVQGRGQTGRTTPGHQEVRQRVLTSVAPTERRRAAPSTRMRVVNSAALAAVNTSAVTHALCTSGRANPSTATAT